MHTRLPLAEHQLALGLDVIGDAVNSLEVGREIWRRAARNAGAPWRVIHVLCSDVEAHQRRLSDRERDIAGFPEPMWDQVEGRLREFEPWPEPTLVLDSVNSLQSNVEQAFGFVRS